MQELSVNKPFFKKESFTKETYLLKIPPNFEQTLKNGNYKVQKSYLTDGDNKRFKVKICLFHLYFVFFNFNRKGYIGCGGLEKIVGELKAGKVYFLKNRKSAKS